MALNVGRYPVFKKFLRLTKIKGSKAANRNNTYDGTANFVVAVFVCDVGVIN